MDLTRRLLERAWRKEGAGGRLLRAALLPASWAYGAAAAVNRGWRRILPGFDRDVPVVLIGNLTVGGTGKTPLAIAAADRLRRLHARPAVVSRGWGGRRGADPAVVSDGRTLFLDASAAGDEPVMMARSLPGVPVVVGRDRVRAARLAVDRLGARSIVLDDGFQQRFRFPNALRVLAVRATDPWGGGALLPAGTLREPARAAASADVIVLTRCQAGANALRRVESEIEALAPRAPVLHADHWWTGLRGAAGGGTVLPISWLNKRAVLTMIGIADPWPFEAKIQSCGGRLAASCVRPDHYRWTPGDVARAMDEAVRVGADAIVTTAKDAVRMPLPPRPPLPVLVAESRIRFSTERELARFGELLSAVAGPRPPRAAGVPRRR